MQSSRTNLPQSATNSHAAPNRDCDGRSGHGRRGPDRPGGHGGDRVHLGYIKRVPLTTYRRSAARQGPLGHGHARRGFRYQAVRRQYAHARFLFFSSRGIVYKEKRSLGLPIGTPQSRGKALINMLPLEPASASPRSCAAPRMRPTGKTSTSCSPTTRGTVRRNKLSDCVQVNRNGKIAMKLEEEGDEILSVDTCTEFDDVVTTALGQCIRFPVAMSASLRAATRSAFAGISLGDATGSSRWPSSLTSKPSRGSVRLSERSAAERSRP